MRAMSDRLQTQAPWKGVHYHRGLMRLRRGLGPTFLDRPSTDSFNATRLHGISLEIRGFPETGNIVRVRKLLYHVRTWDIAHGCLGFE